MTALYKDGTVTLVQGSPKIVGNDTGWEVAIIVGGTVFVEAEGGAPLPILPDDSDGANLHPITNTEMTAAIKWTGASGTYNYAIVRDMSYSRQQSANAEALAMLLQRLNNPSLAAVSGLVPEDDSLILFTGPDTATVIARASLVQGVDYDEDADDIAGRNLYSSEAKGFSVLVANAGDGRTAIFIKRSNTDGDWSVPFYLSGPIGPKGDTGAIGITDAGIYSATSAYAIRDAVLDNGSTWLAKSAVPAGNPPPVLPATQNDYWRLLARRGTDGTGIGDMVGPNGGVVDGRPVAWDGNSGKFVKPIAGPLAALHALVMSANTFPYFNGAASAALADLTPFARTLLDDANGAAMFATLGAASWGSGVNRGIKLPDGTIIQFGIVTATGGNVAVAYPQAFPSVVYMVVASCVTGPPDGTTIYTAWADSFTLSTFAARGRYVGSAGGAPGAGAVEVAFIAIGR